MCLALQLVTGIFLAMHYTPHIDHAFISVEHIMRDVNNGIFMRFMHANGASMFFGVVYLHMFRGLYYGSYIKPRQFLWKSGVVILLLMMATAFMGYVLPWGQMSFWAATVITNLFSAIPLVGESIVNWLWGGFSVDNPTLNRFFSLHFLLPFVIAGLAILHLILLHSATSSNPLGIESKTGSIAFYPYFSIKDIFSLMVLLTIASYFFFFAPDVLGHSDNYIAANPMVTPEHIVPEWYFLPFYAILRSIPDKLGGVICMILAILILLVLPYLRFNKNVEVSVRSNDFKPFLNFLFWCFVFDTFLLGWIGQQIVEEPYILIGQLLTLFYFGYFFILFIFMNSPSFIQFKK